MNGKDGMNSLGGELSYRWDLLDELMVILSVASSKLLGNHSARLKLLVEEKG